MSNDGDFRLKYFNIFYYKQYLKSIIIWRVIFIRNYKQGS